jgi:hypothetical protein
MLTTYAVSLTAPDRTERDRIVLVDLLTDWLLEHYPIDSRPAGTSVRVRERSDDPVFRITINETSHDDNNILTATVALLRGELIFDVRNISVPTNNKIAPHPPNNATLSVVKMVRAAVNKVSLEDANMRVRDVARTVATEIEGQEIGAFLGAPSRRLPVIVEVVDTERNAPPLFKDGLGPLVGLAHLFMITSAEALQGFVDMSGLTMITPGSAHVCWAGPDDPLRIDVNQLPQASRLLALRHTAQTIISTAALSLPVPHLPPAPRDDDYDDTAPTPRTMTSGSSEEWIEALADTERRVEELESFVMELEASLTSADRMLKKQRDELEAKGVQFDELVLRNVSLEMQAGKTPGVISIASVQEALRMAQEHCPFLTFHERALDSGKALQGPDPVLILQDLVRLNAVARAWMAGEFPDTSIVLACRQMGLDYAARVSDTARQKFEEDYLIQWRGKPVLAESHIRRGRKNSLVRIHVYFDKENHQVVVAYIGRHLRDKGSSN